MNETESLIAALSRKPLLDEKDAAAIAALREAIQKASQTAES